MEKAVEMKKVEQNQPESCINKVTFRDKLREYKKHPKSLIVMLLVMLSAVFAVGILLFLMIYILANGIPHLTAEQFEWKYTPENQSMMPAIINTLTMTVLTLLIAVPVGIFAAVYLVEYAKRGNKLVKIIRVTTETLSGIPSIVYGLFGFLLFNMQLGWQYAMLGGIITLAIMILPLIIRTTEEALLAVPDSYREGSYGLGAGKMRTVFRIILPAAIPGIMSGVILSIGRIVGESAALIYTSGTFRSTPSGIRDSAATLTVHMYVQSNEGLHVNQAFASGVILLALTFLINLASDLIERYIQKKKG
ncbi:MAG: phosphate ABC transporter permease PstA [Oscillospiraceae bacterium]|nr:phosphate ABC transporter permease PstA [Oscillospiraceae bacterium]